MGANCLVYFNIGLLISGNIEIFSDILIPESRVCVCVFVSD
jgi:hypothetical protein